jgi:hypothetical protein
MRLKFLLFVFLLWGGVISAQEYIYTDTINYLVITEYRGDNTNQAYLELTNMGDKPVQLNQFKIGNWGGGNTLDYVTGKTNKVSYRIPVDKILQPGEVVVFATVRTFEAMMYAMGLEGYSEKDTHEKMWEYADYPVYNQATGIDPVSLALKIPFNEQWGANGFFIQQMFADGDSMVVDQVVGMFLGANGANLDRTHADAKYAVAGIPDAIRTAILVRKASVKTGNLNFNEARGVGLEDSEWIPLPKYGGAWRAPFWTVGNQGDYRLTPNTLESDVITVDFANKKLTVPWGVIRGDDIMNYFVQKPGIAWEYVLSPSADSLSHAAQTGDQLHIYVCGNNLDFAVFDIIVKEPAADANRVVKVANEDPTGDWRSQIQGGSWGWPRVTQNASGNDSIWGARGGIPYSTRVDSLLKQLEKPSNAQWEIVYASGVEKPDLSHGDKLKVTAQNGSVKEYFISVLPYRASDLATLRAIQWPDIPEFYKGIYGWVGDTIPGFGPNVFNYNIEVPLIAEGIPSLVATSSDVNATIEVNRAKSLSGTEADRTVTFQVTAESDTTIYKYSVVLSKELDPENLQPNHAEPFISEVSHNMYWLGSRYMEICNPGNQPLDLSNYMITMGGTDPAPLIANENAENWLNRYEKYIPGYKWPNEADWVVKPYLALSDISVNTIVQPGDVFVMGYMNNDNNETCRTDWNNPGHTQLDVQFNNRETACNTWVNQWGELISNQNGTPFGKWHTNTIYLFKILNDSIKQGTKPATDPNDFQLIDVLGKADGSLWTIGTTGIGNPFSLKRKPHITKGTTTPSVLGPTAEEAEYIAVNSNYYAAQGQGWPWRMFSIVSDIGKHFFIPPTEYMSTVGSVVLKVSDGYTSPQQIKGITTGTKVSDFLADIIKKNENQSLQVTRGVNGAQLGMDAVLNLNDVLTVLSADSTNTTYYVLDVTERGLSSNAILTSTEYFVSVEVTTGGIYNIPVGTKLSEALAKVTIPAGAVLTVVDGNDAYVPLKKLNFDSIYVDVIVSQDTYLEVVAENGTTKILYQLIPVTSASEAYVTSDLYLVSESLIDLVPRGINVQSFFANLVPSMGASMKLVDKKGFERRDGLVADDDKLVVTSADGTVTVVYHISRLATQFVPNTTYLAYILSDDYAIDQVEYKIHGASGAADISEFYSKIRAVFGANAVVVDENGVVKTSGQLKRTDKVQVTSADGRIVVMYTFGQLTATEFPFAQQQIELYPNPFDGRLNVTGVKEGQRIQVYNALGSRVIDVKVQSNHEIVTINEHPAGLYLIVVSEKNRPIGRYKAIKY